MTIDIDKLEALQKSATPGPWIHGYQDPRSIFADDAGPSFICTPGHDGDADLFVAVRNALPELLAEVRRLRRIEEAAKVWMEWGGHCPTCAFIRHRNDNPLLSIDLLWDYCDCGWNAARAALAAQEPKP